MLWRLARALRDEAERWANVESPAPKTMEGGLDGVGYPDRHSAPFAVAFRMSFMTNGGMVQYDVVISETRR